MRVVGVLSWFQESPSWLSVAVAGFARVCDHIVAVDGSYSLLPGARPCSPPEQAEAVLAAAESQNVSCLVHRPAKLFYGNEVEKRNWSLQLAGAGLTTSDWILVFDADCHVFKCEPLQVRAALEQSTALVATYTVLDGQDMLAKPDLAELSRHDDYASEWTVKTKDIYRWHPTLQYGPQHWMVSRDVGGERRWVRHAIESIQTLDLNASLVAYHRTQYRTKVRRDAQEEYYHARDLCGVEKSVSPEQDLADLRSGKKIIVPERARV